MGDITDNNDSVLIVIPAYNEEKSISKLILGILQAGYKNIVVVDDASTDRTASFAISHGAIILPLRVKLGAWGAAQTGIRYGCLENYKYIVTLDADGQHPPSAISTLIEIIKKEKYDVLVGSCPERGSVARHIAWWIFRRLSGASLRDLTSGMRVYGRKAAKLVAGANVTLFDYQDLGVLLYLLRRE